MALGKILFDDKPGQRMKALRKRWEDWQSSQEVRAFQKINAIKQLFHHQSGGGLMALNSVSAVAPNIGCSNVCRLVARQKNKHRGHLLD